MINRISHCVSITCKSSASDALAFLADPDALARWSLGCFGPFVENGGVYCGHSLDTGCARYVKIDLDEARGEVQYSVGTEPTVLSPRIRALVVEGAQIGTSADVCVVSLLTWRHESASDHSWRQTCTYHEAEILIIKAQLEARRSLSAP